MTPRPGGSSDRDPAGTSRPDEKDEAALSAQARRLFRNRAAWAVVPFALMVAHFFLNAFALSVQGTGLSNREVAPLMVTTFATFLGAAWRFKTWRCPRCAEFFNPINPYARRCQHCGLPR